MESVRYWWNSIRHRQGRANARAIACLGRCGSTCHMNKKYEGKNVLGSAQAVQSWGEDEPSKVNTVRASCIVPNWTQLAGNPSEYRVTVAGYPQTWRIESARPGRDWTSYMLTC